MATTLKELDEPKTALPKPLAERNGQTGREENDEEGEEDYGEYFPEQPLVYELDRQGYVCSDGQGMAEKVEHRSEITKGIGILENYFAARPDVYVSGCDMVHYRRGVRTRYISPDLYVVFGVNAVEARKRSRENFRVWDNDGQYPVIIFEYTSKKTKSVDEGSKFTLYEQIFQTPEYILFDPRIDVARLKTRLRGYRLNALGQYELIALEPTPLVSERLYSEQLGLYLETHGIELRFFDPKTGEYLRTPQEEARDRQRAEQQAAQEARKRREAERQVRAEAKRANEEAKRANEEAKRANEEAAARQNAELRANEETRLRIAEAEENARLRAEIAALRNKAES